MNSLCHALFEDTHVNQGLCQKATADRGGAPSPGYPLDGLNAPVNHCKPRYCPEASWYPAPSPLPTPTASQVVAEGRSTHREMCSHREAAFSSEVLPEAAACCLLPFLAHATQQALQVDSLTLKLVNLPQLLYLTTGKSSALERFTQTV